MDLYTLLIFGHIIGSVLGVGGATLIEAHLNQALKNGKMSGEERALLGSDFFVTRLGMALAILTGLGFIYLYYINNQLFRLESGIFWAKMTMVLIIVINAVLLHTHKISLYWGSALSFVSWWLTLIAGLFLSHNIKIFPQDEVVSFIIVMGAYGALLVFGAFLLHRLRERGKVSAALPKVEIANSKNEPIVETADQALGRIPEEKGKKE